MKNKGYVKETIKFYLEQVKQYRWVTIVMVICVIGAAAVQMIPAYLYKQLANSLANEGRDVAVPLSILGTLLVVLGIEWFLWRFSGFMAIILQTNVMAGLAKKSFAKMHMHSINFFNNNFVGSLVKRVNKFVYSFERVADRLTWELLPLIVNVIAGTILLGLESKVMMWAMLLWVLAFCLFNILFAKFKMKYDIARSESSTKMTGQLADTFTNHQSIKIFSGFKAEMKRFKQVVENWRKATTTTWYLGDFYRSIQGLMMVGLEYGMMRYAITLWSKGTLTVGDLLLIQGVLVALFGRIWGFSHVIRDLFEQFAEAKEMTEILLEEPEIKDAPDAKELQVRDAKIEFKNVGFSYSKRDKKVVIPNLSMTIEAGERIGLVGHSGAGKSTVIALLMRMFDVTRGEILIDGQSIQHVTQESLQDHMSLVPQNPILFHRSLIENIRYGRPDATDEEVMEAARLAHCDEFISTFAEGYNTLVGERGVKLSGGQRQRIAIARAILSDAPILILDESTSSLDSDSEALIQEALEELMKDRTVIVVAHRLSTIMNMDRIIVLDHGKVIEEGSHKDLVQNGGKYSGLWNRQVGTSSENPAH